MILHGERDGVDHNEHEDRILKWLRRYKPPHFVLDAVFWYIPDLDKEDCLVSRS